MELVKITFIQLSGMMDQFATPHSLDLRKHNIEDFARATDDGLNVSSLRLARSAAGLFVPDTSRPRSLRAYAPNDWGTDRIAFAMVVAVNNRQRSKTYQYIVGTTDFDGSSGTGTRKKFEKRMKLYFNNITRIHMNESVNKGQRVWVPKIQAHDQILNRSTLTGFDNDRLGFKERPVSLRPTDIFRRETGASQFARAFEGDQVSNLCGAFTSQLKASSRINNSTSHYLSRTLSAYMASAADPDLAHHHDDGHSDTLTHAHDRVEENDLELDPYFEAMKEQNRILDDGYITFGELCKMNPDFDFDGQLVFGERKSGYRPNFENQAGWKGTDNETMAARIISQSLPGIMINSMYSEVEEMILKSDARPGQSPVEVANIWPFVDGISTRAQWPYFEGQIKDVLMHEATCGGRYEISARINCNIDRLIKIHIRIDGGDEAYFEFPACMDAGLAPTLETDNKAFDKLSKGIVGLAAELSARRLDREPGHAEKPSIHTGASSFLRAARDYRDRDSSTRERSRDDAPSLRSDRSKRDW